MEISEHLDAVNKAFDSVRIAAFADIMVQLVLAESTKVDVGQEYLDALCIQTANAFECPALGAAGSVLKSKTEVAVITNEGVLLALRPSDDSSTALLFDCDANIQIKDLFRMARKIAKEIGAA